MVKFILSVSVSSETGRDGWLGWYYGWESKAMLWTMMGGWKFGGGRWEGWAKGSSRYRGESVSGTYSEAELVRDLLQLSHGILGLVSNNNVMNTPCRSNRTVLTLKIEAELVGGDNCMIDYRLIFFL